MDLLSTIILTIVSLLVGGAITFFVSRGYYLKVVGGVDAHERG